MTTIPAALKDTVAKYGVRAHTTVFELTRGALLGRLGGMPALKLTTTGRRSGRPRSTMLTSPLTLPDGGVVIVASYGGDDRHPAWYHNLVADPHVEIMMRGRVFRAVARTVDAEERAVLWPQVTAAYRGYAGYQTRTDREIPVVVCQPVTD